MKIQTRHVVSHNKEHTSGTARITRCWTHLKHFTADPDVSRLSISGCIVVLVIVGNDVGFPIGDICKEYVFPDELCGLVLVAILRKDVYVFKTLHPLALCI